MEILSDIITLDRLAKMFELESPSEVAENQPENCNCVCDFYVQEECTCGTADEEADYLRRYETAMINVIRDLFQKHGLTLEELKQTKKHWETRFRIRSDSWKDAAQEIKNTLNGVGYFHFNSVEEMKVSGPYASYKQVVLHHLAYIVDYPQVYGDYSARYRVERMMR